MTHKALAVLCLMILLLGVPLLWHKMSWQPPPYGRIPCVSTSLPSLTCIDDAIAEPSDDFYTNFYRQGERDLEIPPIVVGDGDDDHQAITLGGPLEPWQKSGSTEPHWPSNEECVKHGPVVIVDGDVTWVCLATAEPQVGGMWRGGDKPSSSSTFGYTGGDKPSPQQLKP